VFANRMMRGQERAEADTGHLKLLPRTIGECDGV
jgi:hypothetical protein